MKSKVRQNAFHPTSQMPIKTKGNESLATQNENAGAEMYRLEITLAGLPESPNRSRYANRFAAANKVKRWKQAVFTKAWPHRPPKPLAKAQITFTRFSSVEPDYDNLVSSFKACGDGLKQAGIIVDDKRSVVGVPTYAWQKCAPRAGRITIEVREAR